jgi:hypothetical protein
MAEDRQRTIAIWVSVATAVAVGVLILDFMIKNQILAASKEAYDRLEALRKEAGGERGSQATGSYIGLRAGDPDSNGHGLVLRSEPGEAEPASNAGD